MTKGKKAKSCAPKRSSTPSSSAEIGETAPTLSSAAGSAETDVDAEDSSAQRPNPSLLMNYCVIIGSIVVIMAGIYSARSVLGPFLMAAFFAVLMISPVNWLRARGIASWLALAVVIIGVLLVGGLAATILGSQIAQFARDIPEYRREFNSVLENYNLELGDFIPFLKDEKPEPDPNGGQTEIAQNGETNVSTSSSDASKSPTPTAEPVAAPSVDKVASVKSVHAVASDAETSASAEPALESSVPMSGGTIDGSTLADAGEQKADKSLLDALRPTLVALTEGSVEDDDLTVDLMKEPKLFPETPSLIQQGEVLGASSDEPVVDFSAGDSPLSGTNVRRQAINAVNVSSQQLFRFLGGLAGQVSYIASTAFIVTLLVVFMLIETAKIPKKLVAALGEREFTNTRIMNVIEDIRNYMAIKTGMSVIVGASVTILLVLSDVQYPLLWGFVAFLLNYIPNIGSVVAAVPPVVLATIEHGLATGIVDAVFFGIINCAVGYVVEPRLLGKGLDLSPLVVLISLIFFGWLLGPVGMFLSPPLAVVLKLIFQSFPETRWVAALMANSAPDMPSTESSAGSPSSEKA